MFVPDYMFETVYDIPLTLLKEKGIRCLLLDIDNTLVPYDKAYPTAENARFIQTLAQNGIRAVFVSNNSEERVKTYVDSLAEKCGVSSFAYAADAGKPSVKKYRALLASQQVKPEEAATVGDQIFTDVLAAARLGAHSFLVKPIKDVENNFFRFKRLLEKPFIRCYRRKNARKAAAKATDNRKG